MYAQLQLLKCYFMFVLFWSDFISGVARKEPQVFDYGLCKTGRGRFHGYRTPKSSTNQLQTGTSRRPIKLLRTGTEINRS